MTPGLPLNTAHAHTWAEVVSGTAWKRHTLAPDGLLTAEYARGPLILWATRPGEGGWFKFVTEAIAKAPQSPALTLEERVEELNTAQVFERFKWAARGKVRHSVRWKTGRRPRRLRKLEALADLRYAAVMADRRAVNKSGLVGHVPAHTAKERRLVERVLKAATFNYRLREIAPAPYEDDEGDGLDHMEIASVHADVHDACLPESENTGMRAATRKLWKIKKKRGSLARAIRYALLIRDRLGLKALVKILKRTHSTLAVLTKVLEAAAFRAHLTRRVKPAPKRHRIRRPLHSRPRPPSAPLAPPVS